MVKRNLLLITFIIWFNKNIKNKISLHKFCVCWKKFLEGNQKKEKVFKNFSGNFKFLKTFSFL